jgi:predicted nucleotide-binding protein (sugar kinase/HSP70/actin superfamily)
MNRSFLNYLFPVLQWFFDRWDTAGIARWWNLRCGSAGAAFCFPVEIAHGFMANLLSKDPDVLFLPHIRGVPTDSDNANTCTCVFVQGEAFYLKSTFEGIQSKKVITPYLDLSRGFEPRTAEFLKVALELCSSQVDGLKAFKAGMAAQAAYSDEIRTAGAKILQELEQDPEAMAIVLFGRPYNAFAGEANKGIPGKFASRGIG